MTGLPGITPDSQAWFMQMAAVPLPSCDGRALHRRLYEEYRIEVPVTRWKDRDLLRISIQGYNTRQDLDRLVAALAALLPNVRR